MSTTPRLLTYQGIPVWRHVLVVRRAAQVVSAFVVVFLVAWFFVNIGSAIEERDIPFGFDFLGREYQTPLGEHFLPYESSDTFGYALVVAATNTILVAVLGVVLATVLGAAIGMARLSGNWLTSKLALAYVEFFRNVPLLVQLLFWFFIVLSLPPVREGYAFGGSLYVSNAGISVPGPRWSDFGAAVAWLALAAAAALVGVAAHRLLTRREARTGRPSYPLVGGYGSAILLVCVSWLVVSQASGDAPFFLSSPEPEGRFGRIEGGVTIRAGLLVLLVGLVIYTSAFIAEIVRAGIQSVGRGQREAARALGLSGVDTLRHVTFPQALRVIIPPLISQFLNLTKNSSLGGAVGYTDMTNVAITMTQTAPAVSIFLLIMLAYLAMSLSWSLVGNLYNRRIQITGN